MSSPRPLSFLQKIVQELLANHRSLEAVKVVLPGKRPAVFMKRIFKEQQQYQGVLPQFLTIEELFLQISGYQNIKGIALWLYAFKVYQNIAPEEDLHSFLKWFPTLLKDWDDMMKFSKNDIEILDYMLSDERIKNWGQNLGEDQVVQKNLNFWENNRRFLPLLKQKLTDENLATSGMIYEKVRARTADFTATTSEYYYFCGFNALSPIEEKLVRTLLQANKAQAFFQADSYYMKDERQEAGAFLRKHLQWKEFNEQRPFRWVTDNFIKDKNIQVFEAPGNIAQTKMLPSILEGFTAGNPEMEDTAVVLMDENLLPPTLESLQHAVKSMNITMGFPLKNLSFSVAMRKLFYLQKQLFQTPSSYYHADLMPLLEELPANNNDQALINEFRNAIESRNLVYISRKLIHEQLGGLSYYEILSPAGDIPSYLASLIRFCQKCKDEDLQDIDFENISIFQKAFTTLQNQLQQYKYSLNINTLEVLVNQLVANETIDFEGEPLSGLQVMGLLETRLLNFKNVILLSVNEGKIPLGNSQNTYLPFDVRALFGMNTFLENDSIYAYHFYRLLQDAEQVYILYNGVSGGLSTGEKSRFVTQIELESSHDVKQKVIYSASEPLSPPPITFEKTPVVIDLLHQWKERISPSSLTSYLYNPINFYLERILKVKEPDEMEEELSSRNFGNLVHKTLEKLYTNLTGKLLQVEDLKNLHPKIKATLDDVIVNDLHFSLEFYNHGINFVHKGVAQRTIELIINRDIQEIETGNKLKILALEQELHGILFLDEQQRNKVSFYGFADRVDSLNDTLRIIDYKTGSVDDSLSFKTAVDKEAVPLTEKKKQAVQLAIYAHCILQNNQFKTSSVRCGIWSFKAPSLGPKCLKIDKEEALDILGVNTAMEAIKNLILEILNPEIPFIGKTHYQG